MKTVGSGLHYFNPFTDKIYVIDMKTNNIALNGLTSLTRDNVIVHIDAAVYYQVVVPRKTFYSVENIGAAVR